MDKLITWLEQNPTAIASLSTAVISGAVALIVVCITQWALSRRAIRELRTAKLEELYLALNQAASDNLERYCIVTEGLTDPDKRASAAITDPKIYGGDLNKKMIMYIRLYFPRLAHGHQKMFNTQRWINDLIYKIHSATPPERSQIDSAFEGYGACIRELEEEIVSNQRLLIDRPILPRRYKRPSSSLTRPDLIDKLRAPIKAGARETDANVA